MFMGFSCIETHSSKVRVRKGVSVVFVQNTRCIGLFLSVMMLSTDVRFCTEMYHIHNSSLYVLCYQYIKDENTVKFQIFEVVPKKFKVHIS